MKTLSIIRVLIVFTLFYVPTSTRAQSNYDDFFYNYYKTRGLHMIMFFCDMGRRYNNELDYSFWDYRLQEKRDAEERKDMEEYFGGKVNEGVINAKKSAIIRVMKENCPSVW